MLIVQYVIGRQYQHQFVTTFGDQLQGGHGHGRCGVAAEGLEQQHLCLQVDLLQLLEDDEAVLLVGHQHWRLHALDGEALQGLLEQCLLTSQGEELLGIQLARKRPESRAAATG